MCRQSLILILFLLCSLAARAAVPVSAQPLAALLIETEQRSPATVLPANRAVLTAQISALIRAVEADVGAEVAAGQLLIRLDDDDARLARDRAQADLRALQAQGEQAQVRLERGEDLFARNFISDDELRERRTTLSVLRANLQAQQLALRTAEVDLSRTRIVAPFDAAIVTRQAQVGALAMPGTPLITVVQSDAREVDADLDPHVAMDVAQATALRFESRGKRWPLTLLRLSPVIDLDTRIQKARFAFSGPGAAIGTSGEVVWRAGRGLLPVPLIVRRDGQLGVFVTTGERARFVALPEAQEGRPARIDLPPDTLIVSEGQSRLQDGDALDLSLP